MDSNTKNSVENFFVDVCMTEEYHQIEYLVMTIRCNMLFFLSKQRSAKTNDFVIPQFLLLFAKRIEHDSKIKAISKSILLSYIDEYDSSGWILCFSDYFKENNEIIPQKSDLFFSVVAAYVLDTFIDSTVDINKILGYEKFIYETNSYNLSKVPNVKFHKDSFTFDGKAYLYNLLTNTTPLDSTDEMPGFARIITENVHDGDVLLRVDERLALPESQMIRYSRVTAEKFRGPCFNFNNKIFLPQKEITVHYNPESMNKLLFVVKKDQSSINNKLFYHIEIETLPFNLCKSSLCPCITTFLHGMYYPDSQSFTHIDFTKNQYVFSDYCKKYNDTSGELPIDHHTLRNHHYKIWCIENGTYSLKVWYKLVMTSLPEEYGKLLNEILSTWVSSYLD